MTENCQQCENWDRKKKVCLKNLVAPCGEFTINWMELKLPQLDYRNDEGELPERIKTRRI